MRAKPILFNTEMVLAILDGRKTVTRRVIKLKYDNTYHKIKTDEYGPRLIEMQKYGKNSDGTTWRKLRPYIENWPPYRKGDILYVREKWQYMYDLNGNDRIIDDTGRYVYAADGFDVSTWVNPDGTHRDGIPWRPSIHMPKEAARIWLRVTDVRVERLQDIDDEGVIAEGLEIGDAFDELWDSALKKSDRDRYGWNVNPYVWVIEFERCEKPEEHV